MRFVIQHRIHNPEKFWEIAAAGASRLPAGLALQQTLASADRGRAVCVWQAPSLPALRAFIDDATREVAANEYFEVGESSVV